jgi:putative heme-binding domain-containing protein
MTIKKNATRLLTSAFALGALTVAAASAAPKTGDAPHAFTTEPDWKAEAILTHPDILYPSTVCCAPDGRIFVAEDPADMPGPPTSPIDRILCLWPDGHKTIFAEHLRAVFGLQYLDGKVYVHQCPIFSVFTDDHGVGKDRVDLINTTNPDCTAGGGFNDHIPSNIRYAMDGYFYMSTGDKGIYHCESNIDHRKAEIHGGGVLRIRPDGTGLEVYCTGTRNHLDVEIDPEDEMFTYDNTDDGQGWWTRFTHMVDGGYYGYPYEFKVPGKPDDKTRDHGKPINPWTLWRIAEYGGGAPTGGTAYNEDALPSEYRGNPICCEWGKGELERFQLARDGGTFKVLNHVPKFLADPGGQFRPVGVTTLPDGMGFLVTDWNYGGWRKDQEAGRLIKLTYTGKSQAAPKPAWFIPAAEGEKFEASTADLIAGLAHPAQSVRLVAQRRLGERGQEAVAPLIALLNDAKATPQGRWSAIWTLDRIDGGKAGREAVVAVAADPKADVSVRRQAIRQLGTRAAHEATQALIAALADPDASIRFRAATALGRIGDASAVPALSGKLDEPDFFTHYAVFTALKRIGEADAKVWPAIVKGFASDKPEIREGTALAVHGVYNADLVRALSEFINARTASGAARAQALLSEAEMHRERAPWDGKWWGTQPAGHVPPPKDTEWDGTTSVLSEIREGLKDSDPLVRVAAIHAMQIAPDPTAADVLVDMFKKDPSLETRKSVLEALEASKSPAAGPLIEQVLADPKSPLVPMAIDAAEQVGGKQSTDALLKLAGAGADPKLTASAVAALGTLKEAFAADLIAKHLSDQNEVAPAAATALGQIGGKPAIDALVTALSDSRPEVRKAAAASLGQLRPKQAIPALVKAADDKESGNEAILALTRMPTADATDAYLHGIAGKDALVRKQSVEALTSVRDAAKAEVEAKVAAGDIKGGALSLVQQIYSSYQPLTVWSLVGPFPLDAAPPFELDKPIHAEGELKGLDGKPVKWRKVRGNASEHGQVDLGHILGENDNISAFAVTDFTSANERDVTFQAGCDDTLTVWLNGEKIFNKEGNGGWNFEEIHMKGHVKAGKNVVVVKCGNISGAWLFSLEAGSERAGKIFETVAAKKPDRDAYGRFALSHEGNIENGSRIFHNAQLVGCTRCHETGHNDGGQVGPSLAGIGIKYDRAKLIESVVYPSAQILDGYEQVFLKTKDGDVQAGIVKAEDDQSVTLFDSAAKKYVIKKSDIDSRKPSKISLMPEGLEQGISEQDFADLIGYLQSLKEKPAETPKK